MNKTVKLLLVGMIGLFLSLFVSGQTQKPSITSVLTNPSGTTHIVHGGDHGGHSGGHVGR